MNFSPAADLPIASLSGARIWLSGSVPEGSDITDGQRSAIVEFVRLLARRVFEHGGYIIHGSHPSFTPTLLDEAARHQAQGGRRDCLTLAVSRYWSKSETRDLVEQWRSRALVYETPEAVRENARERSLDELRQWMAARADAMVVAGGKWRSETGAPQGVLAELRFATERSMPCFVVGGLGGAARDLLAGHRELFSHLRNGLSAEANLEFATRTEPQKLAGSVCEMLERLPLVRGRGSDGPSFRVLALDGGGLKGAFTASALACWEQQTGLRIVDSFDLVAGTSTGGILAIGLGLGLSPSEILEFYRKRGPVIFPVMRLRARLRHVVKHLFMPKYSQATLLRELERAYYKGGPRRRLRDSRCRLVIPAYHAYAGVSHIFRTPHHVDLLADANTEAAQAALATAAAPTFFSAAPVASVVAEGRYFDGGVWANSPAMAAIIEAVCFLGVPLERIDVLSVGTTGEPCTVRTETRAGILGWLWKKKLIELLMSVQQESSLTFARRLTGAPRFLRVNYVAPAGTYGLDSPKEIEELAALGEREALDVETVSQVRSRFLNGVLASPWEPFA